VKTIEIKQKKHFLDNYFSKFSKIGRKSISTGSPGRSRPPEFKKIVKIDQNRQMLVK